jgi:uncharacterized membrane protein
MASSYAHPFARSRAILATAADLAVIAALAVAVAAAVAWLPTGHPALVPLGIAFVLFVPGYAVVAALFPARDRVGPTGAGVALPERLTYAVAVSVAVVPVVGLALSVSAIGFWFGPFIAVTVAVTVLAAVVAAVRRSTLPADQRFDPLGDLRGTLARRDPDWIVFGAVGLVVLASIAGVGYTAVRPTGETYSAVYLLGEGLDGGPVAANFPTQATVGASVPLTVGVQNGEGRSVSYTVVAVLERVEGDGRVTESAELGRWEATVADGDDWQLTHEVSPAFAGDDLRLAYLLFVDDAVPPVGEATAGAADRSAHVWLDVAERDRG